MVSISHCKISVPQCYQFFFFFQTCQMYFYQCWYQHICQRHLKIDRSYAFLRYTPCHGKLKTTHPNVNTEARALKSFHIRYVFSDQKKACLCGEGLSSKSKWIILHFSSSNVFPAVLRWVCSSILILMFLFTSLNMLKYLQRWRKSEPIHLLINWDINRVSSLQICSPIS